jgi:hypothetical protein
MQRRESCSVITPRPLTAVPAEVSAAADSTCVTSVVSIMNTPGEKGSRHASDRAPGQLSRDHSLRMSQSSTIADEYLEGYEIGPVIGEGGFCKVKRATHKASGQCIAVKVINKVPPALGFAYFLATVSWLIVEHASAMSHCLAIRLQACIEARATCTENSSASATSTWR